MLVVDVKMMMRSMIGISVCLFMIFSSVVLSVLDFCINENATSAIERLTSLECLNLSPGGVLLGIRFNWKGYFWWFAGDGSI